MGDSSNNAAVATVTGVTAVHCLFFGEERVSSGDFVPSSKSPSSLLLLPLKSYGPAQSLVHSEVALMLSKVSYFVCPVLWQLSSGEVGCGRLHLKT